LFLMKVRALVVISDGCEDVEAVAPVDVLTRAGVEVTIASLTGRPVKAAYGNTLGVDAALATVRGDAFDALVLPGGLRSAEHLAACPDILALVREYAASGKLVAAICASPGLVLAEAAGVLAGRRASSAPGFEAKLTANGAICTDLPVTVDGNFVTATGPGTALLFGLTIVQHLVDRSTAEQLAAPWKMALP